MDARLPGQRQGGWDEACQQGNRHRGDTHTEKTSHHREEQTFRRELPHDALTPRTDRGAYRQLQASRHPTAEEEARQVGAGNQQNAHRRPEQSEQQETRLSGHLVAQPDHRGSLGLVLRILLAEPGRHQLHLGACRFDGDAGLEPADHVPPVVVAVLVARFGVTERRPEQRVTIGKLEVGRHDPDDGVGFVVETDRPAKDSGVAAECPLPEPVA